MPIPARFGIACREQKPKPRTLRPRPTRNQLEVRMQKENNDLRDRTEGIRTPGHEQSRPRQHFDGGTSSASPIRSLFLFLTFAFVSAAGRTISLDKAQGHRRAAVRRSLCFCVMVPPCRAHARSGREKMRGENGSVHSCPVDATRAGPATNQVEPPLPSIRAAQPRFHRRAEFLPSRGTGEHQPAPLRESRAPANGKFILI